MTKHLNALTTIARQWNFPSLARLMIDAWKTKNSAGMRIIKAYVNKTCHRVASRIQMNRKKVASRIAYSTANTTRARRFVNVVLIVLQHSFKVVVMISSWMPLQVLLTAENAEVFTEEHGVFSVTSAHPSVNLCGYVFALHFLSRIRSRSLLVFAWTVGWYISSARAGAILNSPGTSTRIAYCSVALPSK